MLATRGQVISDDAQLLDEYARTRSPQAFAQITERYLAMVYSTALRRVSNAHLAEDVTQAVFLMLSQRASRLTRGTLLAGWLYRAARYAAANAMRTERRRRTHEHAAAQLPRTESRMNVQWQQVEPVLDAAMDSLRGSDRDLLLLRFFQGQSVGDIGRALGATENTISKRLSRALNRLRDALERRGITTGDAALGAMLGTEATLHVPTALRATLSGTGAGTSAAAIAKGATVMMNLALSAKLAAVAAAALLIPTAVVVTAVEWQKPAPAAQATTSPAAMSPAAAFAVNPNIVPDKVLPEMRFDRVALSDVIEFYSDVTNANIFVDWAALARAGVEKSVPVSMSKQNIRFSAVIELTLQLVARTPGTLGYTVDKEGVIRITSTRAMPDLLRRQGMVAKLKADLPALEKRLPELRLDGTPLADAIDFMRDFSGANIFVRWVDLENVKIDRKTPVSARARDITTAEALDLILVSASNTDMELVASVDKANNVIEITAVPRGNR